MRGKGAAGGGGAGEERRVRESGEEKKKGIKTTNKQVNSGYGGFDVACNERGYINRIAGDALM